MKMLETFLARVRPASTRANPACMKKTRMPQTKTKMLSRTIWVAGATSASWAAAGLARSNTAAPTRPAPMSNLRFTC